MLKDSGFCQELKLTSKQTLLQSLYSEPALHLTPAWGVTVTGEVEAACLGNLTCLKLAKQIVKGWGFSPGTECFLSFCKVLSSTPSTTKINKYTKIKTQPDDVIGSSKHRAPQSYAMPAGLAQICEPADEWGLNHHGRSVLLQPEKKLMPSGRMSKPRLV